MKWPVQRILACACLGLACQPTLCATACVDAEVVIDMRVAPVFAEAVLSATLRGTLVQAAFGSLDTEVAVGAGVDGAFTAAGARETAFLVQAIDPAATPVDPIRAALVIVAGGKPVRVFETGLGQRLGGALPGLGTGGNDALVVLAESYGMGQSSLRLAVVEVASTALVERAGFDAARVAACDDARFGGFVEAIRVSRCEGEADPARWQAERLRAACVDGRAPPAAAFGPAVKGKP